jgi:hypothetical protein
MLLLPLGRSIETLLELGATPASKRWPLSTGKETPSLPALVDTPSIPSPTPSTADSIKSSATELNYNSVHFSGNTVIEPPSLALARLTGRLLFEWLSRRGYQRGQCPHDPLTLYEAIFLTPAPMNSTLSADAYNDGVNGNGEVGRLFPGVSSLRYARGTFVPHEWAGFLTFVPNEHGPHRLAVKCVSPPAW